MFALKKKFFEIDFMLKGKNHIFRLFADLNIYIKVIIKFINKKKYDRNGPYVKNSHNSLIRKKMLKIFYKFNFYNVISKLFTQL